jgi:hypothetical protein
MHAHRQMQTRAQTSNMRGGDGVRDIPIDGSARMPLSASDDIQRDAKQSQHASPRWGHSRAARRVVLASTDRGGTAPAHTGMHAADADAGADVKHAWRRQREGPSRQRERPTHSSARRPSLHATTFNPTQNQSQHGTHMLPALLFKPPPTVAYLHPRTQACTHTGSHRRRRQRQTRMAAIA